MTSMAHFRPRKPARRQHAVPAPTSRELAALFPQNPPEPRHFEAAAQFQALTVVTDDAVRPILEAAFPPVTPILAAIGGAS